MQSSWIVVVAVALSPFVVASVVWMAITVFHRLGERRQMLASLGPSVVVGEHRRRRLFRAAMAAGTVLALKMIVASMSLVAAWVLGCGVVVAAAFVLARGAIVPAFGVDPVAFEHELRSFLDDAA